MLQDATPRVNEVLMVAESNGKILPPSRGMLSIRASGSTVSPSMTQGPLSSGMVWSFPFFAWGCLRSRMMTVRASLSMSSHLMRTQFRVTAGKMRTLIWFVTFLPKCVGCVS